MMTADHPAAPMNDIRTPFGLLFQADLYYVSEVEILTAERIVTGPNNPAGSSGQSLSQNFQVAKVNLPVEPGLPSFSRSGTPLYAPAPALAIVRKLPFAILPSLRLR
jgi:hypothetical protein